MTSTAPRLPLEGIRVIDFGTAWAAPMLTQQLADLGAEVIKVETKGRLDGLRMGRPIVGDDIAGGDKGKWPDLQPAFHGLNRNKLGVTVDIKHPQGLALMKRLIRISDVVCNNFSAGVMKRAGLDFDSLKQIRPDIISIELTGVGQYGPDRDASLYAATITALSGVSSLIGYYCEPPLCMTSVAYGDATASVHGAFALLAALYHRNQTGEGRHIDLAEAATCAGILGEGIMDYIMNGRVASPQGNRHPFMAPHNNYRCRGEDKWISIAVKNDQEWDSLCESMGNPSWTSDDRFTDALSRWENQDVLDSLIATWTANCDPYELVEKLQKSGVAAMPVMNVEDQFFDPHFKERQVNIETSHPLVGLEFLYGIPWRLSDTPREIRRSAPSLGEHNEYVFRDLVGLSDSEYSELVREKAIY